MHFFGRWTLSDELFDKGMAVRKAVLGEEYVARAEANKTDFDADWQRYVTEHAWAAVWTRPGLQKRTRSMLTIAMLASLGRLDELGAHIRATRNTGVTQGRVKEVLLQVAVTPARRQLTRHSPSPSGSTKKWNWQRMSYREQRNCSLHGCRCERLLPHSP